MIIHLNGWPGVGKRTIGEAVAAAMSARFIHNHLLHDVAIHCTGLSDPERWPLYDAVRELAYSALAKRPKPAVFVLTNGLCVHSAREVSAWNHVVDLAIKRQAPLIPIVLEADIEENMRRVQSPDRVGRKLFDPALLRSMSRSDVIQRPNVPELLVLDVTRLTAEEAAKAIVTHVSSATSSDRLKPATDEHRSFR
jgi:gluconate kinase